MWYEYSEVWSEFLWFIWCLIPCTMSLTLWWFLDSLWWYLDIIMDFYVWFLPIDDDLFIVYVKSAIASTFEVWWHDVVDYEDDMLIMMQTMMMHDNEHSMILMKEDWCLRDLVDEAISLMMNCMMMILYTLCYRSRWWSDHDDMFRPWCLMTWQTVLMTWLMRRWPTVVMSRWTDDQQYWWAAEIDE